MKEYGLPLIRLIGRILIGGWTQFQSQNTDPAMPHKNSVDFYSKGKNLYWEDETGAVHKIADTSNGGGGGSPFPLPIEVEENNESFILQDFQTIVSGGPPGPTGPTGPAGSPGAIGLDGLDGDEGPWHPIIGPQGNQGIQGPTGPTGPQGVQGFIGQ